MKINCCHFRSLLQVVFLAILCTVFGCGSVAVTKDTSSDEEQNKTAFRRLIDEVYNKGNMAVFDEIIAQNAVLHDNEKTANSVGMVKRQIRMAAGMYRNMQITIDDMIAEGDMVAMRTTFHGIYKRNGKKITFPSLTLSRFKDGKMIEAWRMYDTLNIFKQMGISSPPQG